MDKLRVILVYETGKYRVQRLFKRWWFFTRWENLNQFGESVFDTDEFYWEYNTHKDAVRFMRQLAFNKLKPLPRYAVVAVLTGDLK